MPLTDCWPLFGLRVVTSTIELRVPNDAELATLCELAAAGIHPPETMPFSVPWTGHSSPEFERNFLQHHWRSRADFAHDQFDLHFAVVVDGALVGLQSLHRRKSTNGASSEAPAERSCETGSWLGLAHQGRGIGKAMRSAAVAFAFGYLDAEVITSGAFADNTASQRVSIATGYELVRTNMILRQGVDAAHLQFELSRDRWKRTPVRDGITVTGWEACRSMFAP